MVFSAGFSLVDNVHEDIPPTNPFPEETANTQYQNWYEEQLAPGPGTMNITGEVDIITGALATSLYAIYSGNVYTGTEGIDDPDGTSDSDPNAWSEVYIKGSIFQNVLYIGPNGTGEPFIGAYKDITLTDPINPDILGINQEGNDVYFHYDSNLKLYVDDNNYLGNGGLVGITDDSSDTFRPSDTLHIDGGRIKFDKLFGKLADFGTLSNPSTLTFTNVAQNATFNILVSDEDIVIPDGNAIFVIGSISTDMRGSDNAENPHLRLRLIESADLENGYKESIETRYDHENRGNHSPFSSSGLVLLYKNNSGSSITTEIKMLCRITTIGGNNTMEEMVIDPNNVRITYMVFPSL
jgi:hypothetical protein